MYFILFYFQFGDFLGNHCLVEIKMEGLSPCTNSGLVELSLYDGSRYSYGVVVSTIVMPGVAPSDASRVCLEAERKLPSESPQ